MVSYNDPSLVPEKFPKKQTKPLEKYYFYVNQFNQTGDCAALRLAGIVFQCCLGVLEVCGADLYIYGWI